MYKRKEYQVIKSRMEEPERFIQVIMGPRQVGKSTVIKQILRDMEIPYQLFSAESIILVIDEIRKFAEDRLLSCTSHSVIRHSYTGIL